MTIASIIGTCGHALLLTAILLRILTPIKLQDRGRLIAIILFLALALLPMGQISAAQFTRGLFGDLSLTSIILLGRFMLFSNTSPIETRQILIMVVITGILFYPAALGIGMIDPYQWGYLNGYRGIQAPILMLVGLVISMVISVRIRNILMLLCLTIALAGFTIKIMEFNNIWDYLIDPILFIYGLFSLGIYFTKQLIGYYSGKRYIHT